MLTKTFYCDINSLQSIWRSNFSSRWSCLILWCFVRGKLRTLNLISAALSWKPRPLKLRLSNLSVTELSAPAYRELGLRNDQQSQTGAGSTRSLQICLGQVWGVIVSLSSGLFYVFRARSVEQCYHCNWLSAESKVRDDLCNPEHWCEVDTKST